MSLRIRPARSTDVPRVSELLHQSFAGEVSRYMPYAQHGIAAHLSAYLQHPKGAPNNHYLVAEVSNSGVDQPVAFAEFRTLTRHVGFLSYICVDRAARGRGIASAIFRSFLARHPEVRTVQLDVFQDNSPAQSMYRKLGFTLDRSSRWIVREAPVGAESVEIPSLPASIASHHAYGFSEMSVLYDQLTVKIGRIGPSVMRCFSPLDFERVPLHAGIVSVFPSIKEVLGIFSEEAVLQLTLDYKTVLVSERMVASSATIEGRL